VDDQALDAPPADDAGTLPSSDNPDSFAAVMLGFARTLRHAGVPATPDRVQAMLSALEYLDVLVANDVYWAGRLTLCAEPADLQRYDIAFAAYFGGHTIPMPSSKTVRASGITNSGFERSDELPDVVEDGSDDQSPAVAASLAELLRTRDLREMSASERDQINRLFELLTPRVGQRRTRRYRPGHHGAVDLGRTVREVLKHGGEPAELARKKRRTKPRPLVLLIDVSGSMEPYADALLRFAHAAVRAAPYRTEVFTFGTRLTRVTRELRLRDADRALEGAASAIPDWSGGTRLGEMLKAFLDLWGQRGAARGAIVVLASDGWERGDPALLGEQLGRLARLAHSLIWVNPHKGRDGFAPVTGGMIAALPHIDELVAGHSFESLQRLATAISTA
jgi:uncharacterized protein with von Willebrand factor type A (vWA) domain